MNRPTLHQFGLAEFNIPQIERKHTTLQAKEERSKKWITGTIIVFTITAFVGIAAIIDRTDMLPVGTFVSFIAGSFLAAIASEIYGCFSEKATFQKKEIYRNYLLYNEAVIEFNAWWEKTQASFWKSLDGKLFEVELAELYRKLGYEASLTKQSDDRGVDIVLRKDGKHSIVQCKAHNKPVGPAVVRDLLGTLIHSKADAAILASLSGFTVGVSQYTVGRPIQLLGLHDILEMQKSADR